MQATTGLIAFEEPMPGRTRPRPADGGMFFGPPGPTPPMSDTGEPWDSDEQWGSVRGTPSPDECEADDEDESAASEEPVPLVPAVRPRSPVRGAASRVWEPDEDFVPPRGPAPGTRPEFPQHHCVRRNLIAPGESVTVDPSAHAPGPCSTLNLAQLRNVPSHPPSTRTRGARRGTLHLPTRKPHPFQQDVRRRLRTMRRGAFFPFFRVK
jgi:hypothetical protein